MKRINCTAEVLRAPNSVVDPRKLIGMEMFSLERVLTMDPAFLDTDGENESRQILNQRFSDSSQNLRNEMKLAHGNASGIRKRSDYSVIFCNIL